VRSLSVIFQGAVTFGSWGRHGRIQQSGLHVSVVEDDILIKPITSKGGISDAAIIRLPMSDRIAVIRALKALS
jgi:hypothetical protein